jgi:hypothetical protein
MVVRKTIIMGVVIGSLLSTPTRANVQAPADWVSIQARHSDLCMDIWQASQDNGAELVQWPCEFQNNQKFRFLPADIDGYYYIQARHSLKCIDVYQASTDRGARVDQWDCDGSNNLKFELIDSGEGYFMLKALHSSMCLDVYFAAAEAGSRISQYDCVGTPNQRFRFL